MNARRHLSFFFFAILLMAMFGRPAAAQETFVDTFFVPHVVVGAFSDGSFFETQIVLVNHNNRAATRVQMLFFADNNGALEVTLRDSSGNVIGTNAAFEVGPLPARGTRRVIASFSGALKGGWAQIFSPDASPLGVGAAFLFFDRNGVLLSEAGVPGSPLLRQFTLFTDQKRGFTGTGLAFINPSITRIVALTLQLFNALGQPVGNPKTVGLGFRFHRAQFVSEFFRDPTDPPVEDFEGSLTVLADGPIAAISLRVDGGNKLTTFPIFPGRATPTSSSLSMLTADRSTAPRGVDFAVRFAMNYTSTFDPTAGKLVRETQFFGREDKFVSVESNWNVTASDGPFLTSGGQVVFTVRGLRFTSTDTHLVQSFRLIDANGNVSNTVSLVITPQ